MTINWKKKQKKGRKSYYYMFRIRFMLVLFAPMLTIVLMFFSSQSAIKEQIMIASSNTLHQFFQYVDSAVDEAQDVCLSILSDKDFQQYSKSIVIEPEKNTYYLWKIQQRLASYGNDKYYDIFAYYPAVDKVVSGIYGTSNVDTYCDVYYNKNDENFLEEFRKVAECSSKKPVLCSLNREASNSYLCVAMRQSGFGNSKYDHILVIVLNSNYVAGWLEGIENDGQNGIFMIMDREKELIFSTVDAVGLEQITSFEREGFAYEEYVNGEKYLVQNQQSDVMKACYAYAIPSDYFENKMFDMYVICGLGTAISIALGIYIAWRQTQKAYQPIEQVVSDLQQQVEVSYDGQKDTEFEFIRALFDANREDNYILSKAIRRNEGFKRNNFIYSLLNGSINSTIKTDNIFRENGIILCSDYFCVIILRGELTGNVGVEMRSFVVANVFEELCNRDYNGYVISLQNNRYVLLANVNGKDDITGLHSLLAEGMNFFQQHFSMTFTVGVSAVQEGMVGIHTAYEEADIALKYSFLLGKEIIIDYQQIAAREFKYLQTAELKMLHVVTDWLADNGEKLPAVQMVTSLMEDYGINVNASLEMVECFKYEAISMFNRVMLQEGSWTDEWKGSVLKLIDMATLEEFREAFVGLLVQLCRRKREIADQKDVCAYVLKYIEENYADEQLSLTLLGEMTGIDSSYLSKMFKEKYSYPISDYITKTRIKNAKEQLKNTNYSIWEIAERNGFLNSNSFIRTFKRNEGITPGAYRELFVKKE